MTFLSKVVASVDLFRIFEKQATVLISNMKNPKQITARYFHQDILATGLPKFFDLPSCRPGILLELSLYFAHPVVIVTVARVEYYLPDLLSRAVRTRHKEETTT